MAFETKRPGLHLGKRSPSEPLWARVLIWLGLVETHDGIDEVRPAEARLESVFIESLPRALDDSLKHEDVTAYRDRAGVRAAVLSRLVRLRAQEIRPAVVRELESVANLQERRTEAYNSVKSAERSLIAGIRVIALSITLIGGLLLWYKLLRLEGSWRGRIAPLPENATTEQTNNWYKQIWESILFVARNRFPGALSPEQSIALYASSLCLAALIAPFLVALSIPPVLGYIPNRLLSSRRARKHGIPDIDAALADASNDLHMALMEKGVLPMLREALDKHLAKEPSYAMRMEIGSSAGLSELPESGHEIPTEAYEQLRSLVRQLPGGSIGVSGPRGVGKTTLLRSFCSQDYAPDTKRFRILVPAPVEYDGRDFVLHLFAAVCREILASTDDTGGASGQRVWESWDWQQWIGLISGGAGLVLLIDAWFQISLAVLGGLLLTILSITLLRLAKSSTGEFEVNHSIVQGERKHAYLHRAALRHLRDISFQQSFSMGWSGGVKLPVGIDAKMDRTTTLSVRPKTYPEIVESFRRFVAEASDYQPVMVGIDELDKIRTDEAANLFLNDIKAVFGIPRCYYLIAVSDDAIASFERRGMPFRDVFDSSLDEIVKVGYLDFDGARRLLSRRVLGLPIPFSALCYSVSGGLARDLIRAARNMFELSHTYQVSDLPSLAKIVVHRELRAKTRATTALLQSLDELEHEIVKVLRWTNELDLSEAAAQQLSPQMLLQHCNRVESTNVTLAVVEPPPSLQRRTMLRLVRELVGFYYYCVSVLEFFDEKLDEDRLRVALSNEQGPHGLGTLARSRQAFAANSWLAWDAVTEFRTAWGFKTMELMS